MAKLLIMTDLHVTVPPDTIIGLDPGARLALGLAHAAAMHPDADRLILTGDLTHHGQPGEYLRLRALLADLPWPVTLLLGNHDDRGNFLGVFPDCPTSPGGFVQDIIDLGDLRLITLDSLAPELGHAGRLCEQRLEHLRLALAGSGGRPCLVFVHHAPFDTGFAGMDGIGLVNAAELRDVLRGSPCAHLFAGHIHRTITASIEGLSMTVFKSTCHQMPMLLGQPGTGHSVDEPGAYGIVLSHGTDIVVHFEDFTLPPAAVHQDLASQ